MAMRSLIKHVLKRGEPTDDLHVAGWVRTRRDSKGFSFIELNDGTCLGNLQIVAGVSGTDLRPDARRAGRHHGVEKADDVHAFLQHPRGETL